MIRTIYLAVSLCLLMLLFTMFCDCQFTHTTGWGGAGNGKRSHQAMLWRRLYDMQSLDYTSKGEATGQRPVGKYWRTKDNGDHFDLRELVAVPNKTEWQDNYNKKLFMSTASLQQLLEILKRINELRALQSLVLGADILASEEYTGLYQNMKKFRKAK